MLFALSAAWFYFSFLPDGGEYVPTDSVYYAKVAKTYCGNVLNPVYDALIEGEVIGLNWASIISIGSAVCGVSSEHFNILVFALNLIIFGCILFVYMKVLHTYKFSRRQNFLFYSGFLLQPYLILNLLTLNKEIYSYLFISVFLWLYLHKKRSLLILASVVAGLVKVQFLLVGFVLIAILSRIKFIFILIAMSLLLPILYMIDLNFLSTDQYYSRYSYEIRTEEIAKSLNNINMYPFGYLLVMPVRFVINILAGLSPFRLLSFETLLSGMYQISALIFSIMSLAIIWKIAKNKLEINRDMILFILGYSVIICILPFFQMRYFFPLFPLLLILFLMNSRQWRSSLIRNNYQKCLNTRSRNEHPSNSEAI